MKFRDYLNEAEKIILKPVEPNWRQDYHREGEILLKDKDGNLYRSYHEGKLHHWNDTYFNLFRVVDPNDYFSETKILNTSRYELDLS